MLSPFLFLLLWSWDEVLERVSSPSALIIYKEKPELSNLQIILRTQIFKSLKSSNYQLSIINYELSIVNCQLSIIPCTAMPRQSQSVLTNYLYFKSLIPVDINNENLKI